MAVSSSLPWSEEIPACRQAAVPDQFQAVAKRHHVAPLAVQDHRARLDRGGRAPPLPRRAKQDQRRVPGVDIHRHGTATAGTDHDIGPVLVKFGLGDGDGGGKTTIRQGRKQDGVAVVLQVTGF